ncbi:hypothetical protein PHLGIDRAFT_206740 [Phlebiopsis gigantea 11061_1 CR5-6]|uniref:Uncharacterized protein n=1 Tax=Phlebiopsis gigantea (strain 11061_1 CR5-6) TaxID=745531 RepID=A0A0C3PF29_PHLG1|nr:hypothetical protein PHLGIDRAFT_206740 [Phlebiopsis gigantea 11061_1 CR5-6]
MSLPGRGDSKLSQNTQAPNESLEYSSNSPLSQQSTSQLSLNDDQATANNATQTDIGQLKKEDDAREQASGSARRADSPEGGLRVHFTSTVKEKLDERELQDHEKIVKKFAQANYPNARRVNVRKEAHVGGSNPLEPEHITASIKGPRLNKSVHIYTDRE